MLYQTSLKTPLGRVLLVCDDQGLLGLWFYGAKHFGRGVTAEALEHDQYPILQASRSWLEAYFSGEKTVKRPPIRLVGTSFQLAVWQELLAIPYGQTRTYKEVAEALVAKGYGKKPAFQAVGAAIGRNPISLLVPCHRVLGSDGRLTGYAGGLARKKILLEMEQDRL